VVDADVAVVTNIGGDHTDFSPGWRHAVASEKAGIIKPDSFLVLGEDDPELRSVFDDELRAQGAVAPDGTLRRWVRGDDFEVLADRGAVGGHLVDLRLPGHDVADVFVPVLGAHQAENAVVAVAAVEALFARALEFELIEAAFADLRLPGRFEVVNRDPLTVLDGAHNPPGLEALAEAIDDEFGERSRRIFVVGQLDGRDPRAAFEALRIGRDDVVVACTAPSPRGVPAATVAAMAGELGVRAITVDDVGAALARAQSEADEADDIVVVTGSLYVVGAARDALRLPVI
jgi:dihydrofolate synthase/folylpolyglutamate synthase